MRSSDDIWSARGPAPTLYWRAQVVAPFIKRYKNAGNARALATWQAVDAALRDWPEPKVNGRMFLTMLDTAAADHQWVRRGRPPVRRETYGTWEQLLHNTLTSLRNTETPLRRLLRNFGHRRNDPTGMPLTALLERATALGDMQAQRALANDAFTTEYAYLLAKWVALRACVDRVQRSSLTRGLRPPESGHWATLMSDEEKERLRALHDAVDWGERLSLGWDA